MLLQFIIGYLIAGVIFSGIITAIWYGPGPIDYVELLTIALLWPIFVIVTWIVSASSAVRLVVNKIIELVRGKTHDTAGTNQTDA